MRKTIKLTPTTFDTGEIEAVFSLALERIAQDPSKAEQYIKYAQNLLESLGAVNTLTVERRSA